MQQQQSLHSQSRGMNGDPNQSQAIAGAMKALQQKLGILQEQNQLLVQQNQDLQVEVQSVKQKSTHDKEKLGLLLHQQKMQFQKVEVEQRIRIDEDFKNLSELKVRVEQSSRALDKLMKENISMRKINSHLEKQLMDQDQANSKKLIQGMQELRESEMNAKKKCKKLSKEKKELIKSLKMLSQENLNQKDYYAQLINDLELKLKEMINANQCLNDEYQQYKIEQHGLYQEADCQLQDLKQMLAQGQFAVQTKDQENQELKRQLLDFSSEITQIKNQLSSLSKAHQQSEMMRKETENFVCEVVNVNEMLVKSIQKRKSEADLSQAMRRSHNNSQISCYGAGSASEGMHQNQIQSNQISYREAPISGRVPYLDVPNSQVPLYMQRNAGLPRQISQQQSMQNLNGDLATKHLPQSPNICLTRVQSLHPIPQSLSSISQEDQHSKRVMIEAELSRFQQKYDDLIRDIESSKLAKMPLQMMQKCEMQHQQESQLKQDYR